jgi:RNA-directed DNA polymerase
VADGRVLELVRSFLTQGVMEGTGQWTPTAGAPQGAVLSPLLSNVYLDPLDHHMSRLGFEMVRYADDFVVLCQSQPEAQRALDEIKQWTAQAGLTLHPDKTRIVDEREDGFEFLGYRFGQGRRVPRDKSRDKFKDAVRAKTRRTCGDSLKDIIQNVNRTLRGWYAYFKHSHRWTFTALDAWIRMRLRSILRRRAGQRGRGRGTDHQRWPNRYFADLGLFSLATAHRQECQSIRVANH